MNEITIFPLISVFYSEIISVLYKLLTVWNTEVSWNRQGLTFLLQLQCNLELPYKQHKNYALVAEALNLEVCFIPNDASITAQKKSISGIWS